MKETKETWASAYLSIRRRGVDSERPREKIRGGGGEEMKEEEAAEEMVGEEAVAERR